MVQSKLLGGKYLTLTHNLPLATSSVFNTKVVTMLQNTLNIMYRHPMSMAIDTGS